MHMSDTYANFDATAVDVGIFLMTLCKAAANSLAKLYQMVC